MEDETIFTDSAGHTMIDFEAIPAADHMAAEAVPEPRHDDEDAG